MSRVYFGMHHVKVGPTMHAQLWTAGWTVVEHAALFWLLGVCVHGHVHSWTLLIQPMASIPALIVQQLAIQKPKIFINPCVVFIFLLFSQCSWVWWTRCLFGFQFNTIKLLTVKMLNRYLLHPNYKQYKQHLWLIFALLHLLDHINGLKCQTQNSQKCDPHILKHLPLPLHHHQMVLSLPKSFARPSEQRIFWPSWSVVIRTQTGEALFIVSRPKCAAGIECEKNKDWFLQDIMRTGVGAWIYQQCCNLVQNGRGRNTKVSRTHARTISTLLLDPNILYVIYMCRGGLQWVVIENVFWYMFFTVWVWVWKKNWWYHFFFR